MNTMITLKILPAINDWHLDDRRIKAGKLVAQGFSYTSDNNQEWMSYQQLAEWISKNKGMLGWL